MRPRSVVLARLRLRLPRSAVTYWSLVALLILVTVLVLRAALHHARGSTLGPPTEVVVATDDIAAGTALAPHVTLAARPSSLVPSGALTKVPAHRVATAFIAGGEVVLARRVSGTAAGGPAGLIPPGERALTVPVGGVSPPVRPGDLVEVLATPRDADPSSGPPAAPAATTAPRATSGSARVVVRRALVVAAGDDGVTLAIPNRRAPALAAAIARATVTLALTGPGS